MGRYKLTAHYDWLTHHMFETVIEINQFPQIYYELTIMFNYGGGWHDRDAKKLAL